MSIDTSVYLGPYLLVTRKKIIVKTTLHGCSNPNCKKNKEENKERFCSLCGFKNDYFIIDEEDTTNLYDVLSGFENSLIQLDNMGCGLLGIEKNQVPLFSNYHNPFEQEGDIDHREGRVINLENMNIVDQKEWFKNKYSQEIALLEEACGKEGVELKFGLIINNN